MEKCMKMKEIGPRRQVSLVSPREYANAEDSSIHVQDHSFYSGMD